MDNEEQLKVDQQLMDLLVCEQNYGVSLAWRNERLLHWYMTEGRKLQAKGPCRKCPWFPISKPQLASQWVQSLSRKGFIPTPNSCLCSEHFEADCFRDYNGRQFLREDAVPTIFTASRSPGTETPKIELRRNRGIITKDGNKIPVNQFSTLPERDKLSERERPKLRASEKQGSAASLKGGENSAHPVALQDQG